MIGASLSVQISLHKRQNEQQLLGMKDVVPPLLTFRRVGGMIS